MSDEAYEGDGDGRAMTNKSRLGYWIMICI